MYLSEREAGAEAVQQVAGAGGGPQRSRVRAHRRGGESGAITWGSLLSRAGRRHQGGERPPDAARPHQEVPSV